MQCRSGCGACCIAPSISTPLPGLPDGKPAGMRCPHLDAALRCRLWGDPRRPAVCDSLKPAPDLCGENRNEAMRLLERLEVLTAPVLMAAVLFVAATGNVSAQGAPVTSNVPPAAPAVAPPPPAPVLPPDAPPELEAPHLVFDRPAPPRIVEDPARTADAPTSASIAAALTESDAVGARTLAEKALASSRITYGPDDVRTLIPLINLATVKQGTGDLSGALVDYQAAVTLGENKAGPRDERLFNAWYGIGTTNLQAGRLDDALESLSTSLQLHRINNGLYTGEQLEILHAIALAQGALTKREDAFAIEQRRIEVAERVYGLGKPELAPIYNSVARWYRDNGFISDAIVMHAFTLDMLEKAWGKQDARLFPYLIEMARSAALRRMAPDQAQLSTAYQPTSVLDRARVIAETPAFGTPEQQARALLLVGDTMFLAGRREKAAPIYTKAAAGFTALKLPSPLVQPVFLYFNPPGYVPGRRLQPEDGYVLSEFTVDDDGKAKNVRIVETKAGDLPKEKSEALVSAIKRALLRPRYVDGKPVATVKIRFRLPVRGDSGSAAETKAGGSASK